MKTAKLFLVVIAIAGTAITVYAESAMMPSPYPQGSVARVESSQYDALPLNEVIALAKKDDPREVKEQIARAIGKKTPVNSSEVLGTLDFLDALNGRDGDDLLQGAAKEAIGKIKDAGLAPIFAARIKDGGYASRLVAIQKVAEFKYKKAVPDLSDMIKGLTEESARGMKPQEAYLKLEAFNALGEIGDESAIPAVLEKLGKLNGRDSSVIAKFGKKVLTRLIEAIKTSKSERERESAYSAISSMTDKDAIPTLWETAKNTSDSYLKNVAIGSLLKSTNEATHPTKKEVSEYLYAEADVRKTLRPQMIGIAKKNKDAEYLLRIANDKSPDNRGNRVYAIIGLGEIRAADAVPMLEAALMEPDKEVRINAAMALQQITGKEYDWRQR